MTRKEFRRFLAVIGEDEIDPPPGSIWDKFFYYYNAHPELDGLLYGRAKHELVNGKEHSTCRMLFEQVRNGHDVIEGVKYRMPDKYISRYARWLMYKYPELAGFFEVRELTTK